MTSAGAAGAWQAAPASARRIALAAAAGAECGSAAGPPGDLPCNVLRPENLRATGAVAFTREGDAIKTVTARQITGTRLRRNAQ